MVSGPLFDIHQRMGRRQRFAGIAFIVLSFMFLLFSVAFQSVVLQVDSVVSFCVAAILLLKEGGNTVHSRVLDAAVTSLETTVTQLSSKAGSKFAYTQMGKTISEVTVVESSDPQSVGFRIAPPGMGLARMFAREVDGLQITMETLAYLVPSVFKENLGLAEAIEVATAGDNVEVLLREPKIACSCERDEPRADGVLGCAVSSVLATLYCYGSRRDLNLGKCAINSEQHTWKVRMTLGNVRIPPSEAKGIQ